MKGYIAGSEKVGLRAVIEPYIGNERVYRDSQRRVVIRRIWRDGHLEWVEYQTECPGDLFPSTLFMSFREAVEMIRQTAPVAVRKKAARINAKG